MEKGKAALPSSVLTAQDTERATEAEPPGRFLRGELMLRCPSEAGGRGGRERREGGFVLALSGVPRGWVSSKALGRDSQVMGQEASSSFRSLEYRGGCGPGRSGLRAPVSAPAPLTVSTPFPYLHFSKF